MSYFAEPNFIIYDEWFDEDLEKTRLDTLNKKKKTTLNMHEFFYTQSNYKIGGSENNYQLDINVNTKELKTNKNLDKISKKNIPVLNKKFRSMKRLSINELKFNITKKFIYSISIIGFTFISAFLMFFISQSGKNESKIITKSFLLEKNINFLK